MSNLDENDFLLVPEDEFPVEQDFTLDPQNSSIFTKHPVGVWILAFIFIVVPFGVVQAKYYPSGITQGRVCKIEVAYILLVINTLSAISVSGWAILLWIGSKGAKQRREVGLTVLGLIPFISFVLVIILIQIMVSVNRINYSLADICKEKYDPNANTVMIVADLIYAYWGLVILGLVLVHSLYQPLGSTRPGVMMFFLVIQLCLRITNCFGDTFFNALEQFKPQNTTNSTEVMGCSHFYTADVNVIVESAAEIDVDIQVIILIAAIFLSAKWVDSDQIVFAPKEKKQKVLSPIISDDIKWTKENRKSLSGSFFVGAMVSFLSGVVLEPLLGAKEREDKYEIKLYYYIFGLGTLCILGNFFLLTLLHPQARPLSRIGHSVEKWFMIVFCVCSIFGNILGFSNRLSGCEGVHSEVLLEAKPEHYRCCPEYIFPATHVILGVDSLFQIWMYLLYNPTLNVYRWKWANYVDEPKFFPSKFLHFVKALIVSYNFCWNCIVIVLLIMLPWRLTHWASVLDLLFDGGSVAFRLHSLVASGENVYKLYKL